MAKEKDKQTTTPEAPVPGTSTEVLPRTEAPLPTVDVMDMQADAGVGFAGVSQKDVAIPYLQVLQALSPQVKRGPGKVEGAEEGDLFNTVTAKIYKGNKGVLIIPCAFQKRYVEWVPREQGGGFVKAWEDEKILEQCKRPEGTTKDLLPNGHEVRATAYHYVLVVNDDGSFERVVMSLSSTQLKKSRKWLSQQMGLQLDGKAGKFTPPSFSHTYKATTTLEQKDQNSWYGWLFEQPTRITRADLYAAGKKFAEDVSQSKVEVAPPPDDSESTTSSTPAADEKNF